MKECDHRSFTHGVGPNDLPCREGKPVVKPYEQIVTVLNTHWQRCPYCQGYHPVSSEC